MTTAIHPSEDPMGVSRFVLPDVPRIEDEAVCVFCEKPIWKDTEGWRHECSGEMPICNSIPEPKYTTTCPQCEGVPDLCNGYCEGTGKVTTNHAAEWHRQND